MAKFAEHRLAPVLWASSGRPDDREPFPKFSGSRVVSSRNSLQRILAAFVATLPGVAPIGDEISTVGPLVGRDALEIATAYFRE